MWLLIKLRCTRTGLLTCAGMTLDLREFVNGLSILMEYRHFNIIASRLTELQW